MSEFKFQPRWKEELVVTGSGGSLILELPMGILSAYLPTEEIWIQKAPSWAKGLYHELKSELEAWCMENKAQLIVNTNAGVY